jgi:site-specific DNA recombinase
MKAGFYGRISTDKQRAESIDDQFRKCEQHAKREGWKITARYADLGISGSRADRPQYQAMLAAAERKEFGVLLLDDLSRLGRDQVESERAARRLKFHGVRVIAVADGYDSDGKSAKVHRGVKSLMNEIYLDDLRDKTHRGLEGQVLKQYWTGGRPYGYALHAITDPSRKDAYGNPTRIGTKLVPDKTQAKIAREIFTLFADGHSERDIAARLNKRGIPSPGSTWNRTQRRAAGWMGSGIRAMLMNELYGGEVIWNRTAWEKHPDSGMRRRRNRPESEWKRYQDAALRIVPAKLWDRTAARIATRTQHHVRSGYKARYLLSGLLKCGECGSHFVMGDARSYCCSSFKGGKACSNAYRVPRQPLQDTVLAPIRKQLLDPDLVRLMADEMRRYYAECIRAAQVSATEAPKELQELDARLARLRDRLKAGDPDLTPDELQVAIQRADAKRAALADSTPAAKAGAKVLTLLPAAADAYRRQIEAGLDGHPTRAAQGRQALRELLRGHITLKPAQGGLLAVYSLHGGALVQRAVSVGSGGRI